MPIPNPNSDNDYISACDITSVTNYPKFLHSIEFKNFKQINELKLDFISPISVLSGTNKIGKTTILMALACSHFNFKKRNSTNGILERHTWSSFMRVTDMDSQVTDWSYWISHREGTRHHNNKRGQRKLATKKWNGIGKKESQIKNRQVVFIDLERVIPSRNVSSSLYRKARNAPGVNLTANLGVYLSYIFEESYIAVSKLAQHIDKDVFSYITEKQYSGFNSASGEDVVTRILIDIIEAESNALILIDEIEVGLHPKVQRRLLEVINSISRYEHKQFIITTHSPSIFSHVDIKSRIFIDKEVSGNLKCIPRASLNEALTKMDSDLYPILDLFCEDITAQKMIKKTYDAIKTETDIKIIDKLVNIIISGSADKTHTNFVVHKRTNEYKKIKTGYACVLDGDMKSRYATDYSLYFLPGDYAPEKFLLGFYLSINPNTTLQYHYDHSDVHILFSKMVEYSDARDINHAFELCWSSFMLDPSYELFVNEFKYFLVSNIKKFSK